MPHILNELSISNHHIISDFKWSDIPQIVLLTGLNGSGKTKFLEAINSKILKKEINYNIVLDCEISEREFGYIPWQQNIGGFDRGYYATMQRDQESFINKAKQKQISERGDQNLFKILEVLEDRLGEGVQKKHHEFYQTKEFEENFRVAWIYSQDVTLNKYIGRLFINYKIRQDEAVLNNYNAASGNSIPADKIIEDIGIPPWELINDLFKKYNFLYRINAPKSSHAPYDVRFKVYNDDTTEVTFQSLSSGEQMIVTLILWSFNEELGELKKLLILDEPDAHLHPEMALMFKEILFDVLVKKFGIQVILTTHSPTTLCWFPEENIFLMDKQRGIVKSAKDDALKKLTSGLILVQEAFRVVLVEDEDDRKFHQTTYEALVYSKEITSRNKLIFKSVATTGINSGGKTNVINACTQWTNFTNQTNVSDLIFGLVDKDNDNNKSLPPNVHYLDRYCHENFLADPLVLFTLLVQEREPKTETYAATLEYVRGEELKFKSSEIKETQAISDFVLKELNNISDIDLNLESTLSCEYINNIKVQLPKSFLAISGKDYLLPLYRKAFPSKSATINFNKLLDQMIKTHLIPVNLKNTYEQLSN